MGRLNGYFLTIGFPCHVFLIGLVGVIP